MDTTIIKVNEIPRTEWRNERVVTTAQLAEFYETSVDNIWQNFKRNRDRFVEGKHFFKLEGDDLEKLRLTICQEQISSMARTAYLWTKRGAARHAKMLNTDRAWEVFEALEDNYFNRPATFASDIELKRIDADLKIATLSLEQKKIDERIENARQLKGIAALTHDSDFREYLLRKAAKYITNEDFFKENSADID